MSNSCTQNCNVCTDTCNEKDKNTSKEQSNNGNQIKKVIGIVSGKGGVGKSLVTSMLAAYMNKRGHKTAILDADITGPSIPKAFGIKEKVMRNEQGIFPVSSENGIDIMSINLLLQNDTDPLVWRGPVISNTVKEFYQNVLWGDQDLMFIDMPPGTGDVPLTVFQSIPVDGIIIVTSPQELVSMIVSKAVKMAEMMNIPILGLIENMSFFKCPNCEEQHSIFGNSHIETITRKHNLKILAKLPIETKIANACDQGKIETFEQNWFEHTAEIIERLEEKI